jgi:hypothetical protein
MCGEVRETARVFQSYTTVRHELFEKWQLFENKYNIPAAKIVSSSCLPSADCGWDLAEYGRDLVECTLILAEFGRYLAE